MAAQGPNGLSTKLMSKLPTGGGPSFSGSVNFADAEDGPGGGTVTKVGTYIGVFQPCLLNIFGSILFLRLGWAVGEAGVWGTLLVFAVAGLLVLLTALSVAAISTNGTMGGGGAYYMISRSLGPEFGTGVGLLFYLGSSSSVAFYIVSFTLCINESFICDSDNVGIGNITEGIPFPYQFENCDDWVQKLHPEYLWGMGSGTLLLLLGQAEIGAGAVLRLNTGIFVVLMASIILAFVAILTSNGPANLSGDTLVANLPWDYSTGTDWLRVFIVVFPSVTGIMAGANYSGNLIDPGKSIGTGTIAAIFFSVTVYALLAVAMGAAYEREGLQTNYFILQDTVWHPSIIIAGIVCSTLSSALGQLDGSARVLQTLARDNILGSYVAKLGYGSPGKDDPRVALLCSWLVAQVCLFIPSLDDVAALVSGFYLLVYLFLNLACFLLKISGVPNFRPTFKEFSWHTALCGSIMALGISFATDYIKASVGIFLMVLLVIYVHVVGPAVPWGDVSQALIFHQVRKFLLQLDERKAHPKFWRPSLLLAVDDVRGSLPLIQFCDKLKKGGLFILASVIATKTETQTRSVALRLAELRVLWLELIDRLQVKAFCDIVVVSGSKRCGVQSLYGSAGLGSMKPNTVVIPFPDDAATAGGGAGADAGITKIPGSPGHVRLAMYDHAVFSQAQICGPTLRQLEEVMSEAGVPMGPMGEAAGSAREQAECFAQMVRDGLNFERNVLVARHFEKLDDQVIKSFSEQAQEMKKRGIKLKTRWYDDGAEASGDGEAGDGPVVGHDNNELPREELLTKMSIDLWTVDPADWENLAGVLALQLQLAYSLSRVGVFAKYAYIRVMAPVLDPAGEEHGISKAEVEDQLRQLLKELRVSAEVVALASSSPAGGPTLDSPPVKKARRASEKDGGGGGGASIARRASTDKGRKRQQLSSFGTLSDMKKIEAFNGLVRFHSSRTCVVFVPLPGIMTHQEGLTYAEKSGPAFMKEVDSISTGLPPCMLVAPGEHTPIVSLAI